MALQRAAPFCFLISLVLHVALVAIGASTASLVAAGPGEHPEPLAADSWVGETFDVDTLASPGEQAAPVGQEPKAVPAPPPVPAAVPKPPPIPSPDPTPPAPDPQPSPSTPATGEMPASLPPASASTRPNPPPVASHADPQDAGDAPPASGEPSAGASRAGSFGAVGRPGGVRNLATAFARAMPMANSADPAWISLPLGLAGSLEVTLEVDDAGKIVGATPKDPGRAPEHLVRLVEKTLILLRAGRFSLSQVQTSAGTETFRLEARIDQVDVNPDEDPSQAGPVGLGFQAPRPGVPGHATFTLRSGRKVDIAVSIVKAR